MIFRTVEGVDFWRLLQKYSNPWNSFVVHNSRIQQRRGRDHPGVKCSTTRGKWLLTGWIRKRWWFIIIITSLIIIIIFILRLTMERGRLLESFHCSLLIKSHFGVFPRWWCIMYTVIVGMINLQSVFLHNFHIIHGFIFSGSWRPEREGWDFPMKKKKRKAYRVQEGITH